MRIMITLLVLSLIGCGDDDGGKNTSNSNNPNSNNPNSNNPNSNNPNSSPNNASNNGPSNNTNNEQETQWELEPTDFHPRISGARAYLSQDATLELDESRPVGWRIEVQANKALTVGFHALGQTDTELGLTLEHPDGTCEIPMSASNSAIQLNVQALEGQDIWGTLVFTVECFEAAEPITFYLGFGSGEFPTM